MTAALLLLLLAPVEPPLPTSGDVVEGTLVRAIDGDTLDMQVPGRTIRVRLAEIDAPEQKQPYGPSAREYLQRLAVREKLRLKVTQKNERFGRVVGHLYVLRDGNDTWVNMELIRNGFAWWALDWSNDAKLAAAERMAWREEKGLWKDARPTPPWEWRKEN